ncbi:MAG: glycosyltransferase family 4 protein, partial [Planctomycetes bacterium]|nr:glycosyltransferase family 4 protein [Planctomycetota bacterium]
LQPWGMYARGSLRATRARRALPPSGEFPIPLCSLRELAGGRPRGALAGPVAGFVRRPLRFLYRRAFRGAARSDRFAAVFEPNHLTIPTERPAVATFHDLSVVERPEWHPREDAANWERSLSASLAATAHFIADSAFTRGRMMEFLGLRGEQITVAHLAPCLRAKRDGVAAIANRSALPARYLLHLGTIEPRKNIGVLLDAYLQLPARIKDTCGLVLCGARGWGDGAFWRALAEHPAAERVACTAYLPRGAADALLAGAAALVIPSRYEGFGLPLAEALTAGVPAIASDIEVFHEVAADAALYALPTDPAAWAAQIARLLDERELAAALARAGTARAGYFSWEKTAATTLAVLREVVG